MARSTLRLSALDGTTDAIAQAARILQQQGTVAFVTETVYGLGANALDPDAIAKIFEAKQRPSWDPLIVHIADEAMLHGLVREIPPAARLWMQRFWPGPMTLLLPRTDTVPSSVTAGRDLVGIRMPAHPVARALIRSANLPVAAPSANRFGHVSPTTAAHVLADLDGRIDAVLDGGPSEHGVESTVVDPTLSPCRVYRPGSVSLAQLQALWPDTELYRAIPTSGGTSPTALPSPGVGIRHYAPRARLLLIEPGASQPERLMQVAQQHPAAGLLLPEGFLPASERARLPGGMRIYPWGVWTEPATMAAALFAGLRALDAQLVEQIVCPVPADAGLGEALRDRLGKAARA